MTPPPIETHVSNRRNCTEGLAVAAELGEPTLSDSVPASEGPSDLGSFLSSLFVGRAVHSLHAYGLRGVHMGLGVHGLFAGLPSALEMRSAEGFRGSTPPSAHPTCDLP